MSRDSRSVESALSNASTSDGTRSFGFAGRDHIRERRERLGIDERHGAADHDQRIARVTIRGERLHPANRIIVTTLV